MQRHTKRNEDKLMRVTILQESGVSPALQGLALSYNSEPSMRVADRLAHKQGGHNKFLESIQVWLDVTAPRYFWQQMDTYRVGISKQSESTMHTIMRGELTKDDFEDSWCHPDILDLLNRWILEGDFWNIKRHLSESFLQRRIISTNYKVLQNIEYQRRPHKLVEWPTFLDAILDQAKHPHWIKKC